ncbi:MAG: hypothetical protein NZM37_13270, partial [Sandaracinaceae bacterium]|nr:hypothetical protein [Sandaracinaceae bacterium]
IASVQPVAAGRGWLANAAFAAGCGVAAFFTWGLGGTRASGETYAILMSGTGLVAAIVVLSITDGLQDSGWDQSLKQALQSIQLDVSPTEGGALFGIRGTI